MKKKPQSNLAKKKPAPTKEAPMKKQTNVQEEADERERVGEEKAVEGEECR